MALSNVTVINGANEVLCKAIDSCFQLPFLANFFTSVQAAIPFEYSFSKGIQSSLIRLVTCKSCSPLCRSLNLSSVSFLMIFQSSSSTISSTHSLMLLSRRSTTPATIASLFSSDSAAITFMLSLKITSISRAT